MKRLFQRLTSPLAALPVILVAGEWVLRAVDFEYPPPGERAEVWAKAEDRAMRDGTGCHRFDVKQLWAPKPGARLSWTKEERINRAG